MTIIKFMKNKTKTIIVLLILYALFVESCLTLKSTLKQKDIDMTFHFWNYVDSDGNKIKSVEPQKIYGELYYVGTVNFCAYLLNTGDGLLLFDALDKNSSELLQINIEKLGFSIKNIKWIFNTHYHYDHVGGNSDIIKQSKAKMYIHEKDIERLDLGFGMGEKNIPADYEVIRLKGGETFTCGNNKIEVVFTPGQSMGSCCFITYVKGAQGLKKVFVIGDASGFKSSVESQQKFGYKGCVGDYKKTIPLMKSIECDLILPGHPHQVAKEMYNNGNPFAKKEEFYLLLDNRYKEMEMFIKEHPEYE